MRIIFRPFYDGGGCRSRRLIAAFICMEMSSAYAVELENASNIAFVYSFISMYVLLHKYVEKSDNI